MKFKNCFKVIDHNSSEEYLKKIDSIFKKFETEYYLINLDVSKFEKEIEKINERGQDISSNQISNIRADIHHLCWKLKTFKDFIILLKMIIYINVIR